MGLRELIALVYASPESDFYRTKWGSHPDLDSLPQLAASDIAGCPLDKRLYVPRGIFLKVAYHRGDPYLVARTREAIAAEDFGPVSYERPLVFFEDAQESLEKSAWHYTRHVMPLIAEDSLPITCGAAERYGIDAIVADAVSLKKLSAVIEEYPSLRRVRKLTLIDSGFDPVFLDALALSFPEAAARLVLALPEVGALAHACEKARTVFHPVGGMLLATQEGELVATQLALLPTPIIAYRTGIRAAACSCACGAPGFSLL